MTSSLVGSEMCIRDSDNVHHNMFENIVHFMQQCFWQGSERIFDHVFETVSYTHLTLPTICSV
eukprot:11840006-Prorocentrum_lima.AAC.1